ncbi:MULTISPECIES: hypothetical protein [unclassified Streptomyces]|uniref:hypothetical protein n=1 Tax=unclassified Streptomyces TaxID=2593676 RepID=UPI0038217743
MTVTVRTGAATETDRALPTGPADLALPLALVQDLVRNPAQDPVRAAASTPAGRAAEVRTAAAGAARGARRRRTAVRG